MTRRALTTLIGPGRIQLATLIEEPAPRRALATLIEARRAALRTLIEGGAPSAAPILVSAPVASGVVRIGQTLTSDDGVWSDADSYTRQWTRDGAPISGATGATYTVIGDDIACELRCEVGASGPGGTAAPVASNALTSAWRLIAQILGADGYLWVMSAAESGVALGAPLASLLDVTGAQALVQPLTSARPTQQADHLAFVADDYLTGDGLAPVFASGAARSVLVVLETVINTSSQMLLSATRVGFASPQWSISAQGRAVRPSGTVVYAASSLPARKPIWLVDAASGSERQIDTTTATAGAIGADALITGLTLGARRLASPGSYLTNGVRALLICARALDTTERAAIRAVLDAQGVTTP